MATDWRVTLVCDFSTEEDVDDPDYLHDAIRSMFDTLDMESEYSDEEDATIHFNCDAIRAVRVESSDDYQARSRGNHPSNAN